MDKNKKITTESELDNLIIEAREKYNPIVEDFKNWVLGNIEIKGWDANAVTFDKEAKDILSVFALWQNS